MKREQLSKELIKKAKDLVGFIDDERLAIKLSNKLQGFENDINLEYNYHHKYIDMLGSIIAQYNWSYIEARGILRLQLGLTQSKNSANRHTQYLGIIGKDGIILKLEASYSSIPHSNVIIEQLALKAIHMICIQGLNHFINCPSTYNL